MSRILVSFVLLFLASTLCESRRDSLQCLDEEGKPVDWFIVYKLPWKLESEKCTGECGDNLYNGVAYLYMDSNDPSKFSFPLKTVNDTTTAFYRTLQPVYDNFQSGDSEKLGYGFYNDARWDGSWTSDYGHTKGAFAFDSETGFWLTHSVPKFPFYIDQGYAYPHSGRNYGQDMICISMKLSEFNDLGIHFKYTFPWFYNVSIPSEMFGETVPELIASAVHEQHIQDAPYISTGYVTSLGGAHFVLFSKYKTADIDILSEMIAPQLQTDTLCQTWQNGGTNLPGDCEDYFWTLSVSDMEIREWDLSFTTHQDHSKWAVGAKSQFEYPSDWMCVGDMNRQESQEQRCGGFVCFRSEQVSKVYQDMIINWQDC